VLVAYIVILVMHGHTDINILLFLYVYNTVITIVVWMAAWLVVWLFSCCRLKCFVSSVNFIQTLYAI